MFNVRLPGGHLYGKQLFTLLSLVVSLMASFVLSFFPLDVLDESWDLIESVSEGLLTYSFDSIDHEKLWNAFTRKNIDAKSFNMFQSVYSKLKSCVQIDDVLTEYFKCSIGTRQGCVSSPIIFSLFINDLITYVRDYCGSGIIVSNEIDKLHTLLFADDVAEFSESRKENPQKLTQLSSRSHPRQLLGTKTA